MTTQDRQLFQALAGRQERLETAVSLLHSDFDAFTSRFAADLATPAVEEAPSVAPPRRAVLPPPIPYSAMPPEFPTYRAEPSVAPAPEPPPLPAVESSQNLPPLPPPVAEVPPAPQEETPGLEFQFGRWLARIGVVFALITLISFSTLAYNTLYQYMGPWSKLGVLTLVSAGLVAGGLFLERKRNLTVYGRTLAGGGLACLYYTLYGATYVSQLHVIDSPLFGGVLLLAWSAAVLWLAERKKSELLSIFAIALAYFSSAITPVGGFTMAANLMLSLTAVIFLLRNAWTGLSYLCLVGTYAGLLRQYVVYDESSYFLFDTVPHASFAPGAAYLAGAWVIYSAGIFLANSPQFAAAKRMAFLCLNNGALVGLLILLATWTGFGHLGAIFITTGMVFLAASVLAKAVRDDVPELTGAYLIQGLGLLTGGIAVAYTGVTRGAFITIESVFLSAAGAYSRSKILRFGGHISGCLGAIFLLGEIIFGTAHPWVLTIGGAVAMLANAWLARHDVRQLADEEASRRLVPTAGVHVLLALALLGMGLQTLVTNSWLGPDLALAALVLTFAVYIIPILELAPLAQLLLVGAQIVAAFPQNGNPSWRAQLAVAAITLVFVAWWPRQRLLSLSAWLTPLLMVYSLAVSFLVGQAIYPHVISQTWMVSACLLSLGFLIYGLATRTWQMAVSGQFYLVAAVVTFVGQSFNLGHFPWTWWAAAFPPATVFITALLVRHVLPRIVELSADISVMVRFLSRIYQCVALALLAYWIVCIVPDSEQVLAFFAIGAALLAVNARGQGAFGIRCGLVLDFFGACCYVAQSTSDVNPLTWANVGAFVLLLTQPAILRYAGRELISEVEVWALSAGSTMVSWLFVTNVVDQTHTGNLTLGWAIFAVILIVLGFVAGERRQRWSGLCVLLAAIVRVGIYDFWRFSDLYKVLTFLVLTVICLSLSYLYYKFGDRLKEWL